MEHQFANRELLDSGELLPVVALNDDGVQKTDTRDGTDVKNSAINYIDDLLSQDVLPPRPAGLPSRKDCPRQVHEAQTRIAACDPAWFLR